MSGEFRVFLVPCECQVQLPLILLDGSFSSLRNFLTHTHTSISVESWSGSLCQPSGFSLWAVLHCFVFCPIKTLAALSPDSRFHPLNSGHLEILPKFPLLIPRPRNSSKRVSLGNHETYYICFPFSGITILFCLMYCILKTFHVFSVFQVRG